MISEGSCDSEDWSNDAENTALIIEINYILISAVKRLIASKIKVFVYIIYLCVLYLFIMYL